MAKAQNLNEKLETFFEKSLDLNGIEAKTVNTECINLMVRNKLETLGKDYDLLSKKVQEYLYKIESIISEKTARKQEALEVLKTTSFNPKSIADTMKISRTTLYNHSILELYIKHSMDAFNKNDPYSTIDELRASISKLDEQVSNMVDRDIDFELIKQQVMSLNLEVTKKEKAYREILERRNILSSENTKLKAELREIKKVIEKESIEKVTKVRLIKEVP
jgi:DNA-binding ferritin-like protein (Dps family)